MSNLSFDVAISSMHYISESGRRGLLDSLGISQTDFDRLVGTDPWSLSERNRMASAMHNLMYASLDSMGLPRFPMPAEMLAAVITVFISGVNVMAACLFVVPSKPAEALARAVEVDPCTPQQIFALVTMMYSDHGRNQARELFEKKCGVRLNKTEATTTTKK